jgi:hypothetical protein
MQPYEKWQEEDLKGDARGVYFLVSYCFILLLSNLSIFTWRLPETLTWRIILQLSSFYLCGY